MRKWLVALTIICSVGFLTTATLAGQLYFKEANVYTDYDKQKLDLAGINSIYINSDIPVEVKPTTEEAYVEFNQKFEDILGENPEFELKVENKVDGCYINLEQTKNINIGFLIKEDNALVTVYLPVKALDTLQVTHESYRRRDESPEINLTGIDIKNLNISENRTNITLDGKYEDINISTDSLSTVKINSKQKAHVKLKGEAYYTLEGLFETVDVNGNYSRIKMNTLEPTKVNINTYRGDINLEGSYSFIKAIGSNNSINIKTNTLSDIQIENEYGNIILDGPLNITRIKSECSNIDIQTIVNPRTIEVQGEENSTVLRLPSNIPGIQLKTILYDYDYDDGTEYSDNYIPNVSSNFTFLQQDKNTYTYGDSSSKVVVKVGQGLTIVDNGYMSVK